MSSEYTQYDVNTFMHFVDCCTSPWHTVAVSAQWLQDEGFTELGMAEEWNIEVGGKYFVRVYGSTLLAFTVGSGSLCGANSLRIAAAHTDFPGFRIKPSPEILRDSYGMVNIEGYGGMINYTWLDRPLSAAGQVAMKAKAGESPFQPQLKMVDFQRPIMTIPSLAIHMNRDVNEGVELNKQKDMLPLATVLQPTGSRKDDNSEAKAFMIQAIADELSCHREDILSYDLNLYPTEKGCKVGLKNEFISSPRLDNITSVYACIYGLLTSCSVISGKAKEAIKAFKVSSVAGANSVNNVESTHLTENAKYVYTTERRQGLNLIALFDNEEIGSRTKQGADSGVLKSVLERIYAALGYSKEQLQQTIAGGFMLSADVAHAAHPNHMDKMDPTNKPVLNGGVVLKQAASQSYAGDAVAVAVVAGLCQQAGIKYQRFVNRSDSRGGSTLGSIASSIVPIRTMDIGVALLAMHSARETMGAEDQDSINRLMEAFFTA